MINLPDWRLTNRFPTHYDCESGTTIEMTAKVYAAMQQLINEYNQFVVELNKELAQFKGETNVEIEQFKQCVTELVENHIKLVDTKLTQQDLMIQTTIAEGIKNLKVEQVYNEETEAMDLILTTGGNE